MTDIANADQIEFWNGPAGQRWAEAQESMDRTMARISEALLSLAAVKPDEAVLDIGCGSGTTTLAYARAAGAGGKATGIDISAPMLGVARARAAQEHVNATFIEADASRERFTPEYDVLASRFGVMFFDDPAGAFANLRSALKPGARLAFVCWRAFQENVWAFAPFAAARDLLPEMPPTDPTAPGPFAFADPSRTTAILESAGFRDVRMEKLDTVMSLAPTAAQAAQFSLQMGPLSRASAGVDDATRAKMAERVADALKPFETANGVTPPAACWLVSGGNR